MTTGTSFSAAAPDSSGEAAATGGADTAVAAGAGNVARGSATSGTVAPAASAAAATASGDGTGAAAGAGQRRRARNQEVQEVIDELAQETKRVTLLERVEYQLKGQQHVSRLVFAFGVADDRKTQSAIDQEFLSWLEKQEGGEELSGVLLFLSQAAIHILEGPTELLFKALSHFHSLTMEVQPQATAGGNEGGPASLAATGSSAGFPRPALIGALRVLYFTELHATRCSVAWCSYSHQAKLQGGTQQVLEQDNCPELVFITYRKLLTLCLKVKDAAGGEVDPERLQGHYRRQADIMPTIDEVLLLLSKAGVDFLFTYPEFEKVFVQHFQLVLNSELLWPMPPPLSY